MTNKSSVACGTYAGYQQHIKAGVPSCEPCKAATREYRRKWRESRTNRAADLRRVRAREQALVQLSHQFPEEFRALYREQLELQRDLPIEVKVPTS